MHPTLPQRPRQANQNRLRFHRPRLTTRPWHKPKNLRLYLHLKQQQQAALNRLSLWQLRPSPPKPRTRPLHPRRQRPLRLLLHL